MSVLVDTSALYAVLDRADANHAAAGAAWRALVEREEHMVITNYAVVETLALLQARLGMPAVRVCLDQVLPLLELHWVSPEEHGAAAAALLVANRRDLSFVDCTSFEAMRGIGITDVFAFDRDFRDQGFRPIA